MIILGILLKNKYNLGIQKWLPSIELFNYNILSMQVSFDRKTFQTKRKM